MVEIYKGESPPLRRRIIPEMKKVAQKSAEGTKKVIQATMELPVATAKATKGAATAVAKAVTFTKREVVIADQPESAAIGAGGNASEENALKSFGSDVMVDAPPVDNSYARVESTGTGRTIVLGRFMDFMPADATIIMIVSLSVALASTLRTIR
jgi:hypothetical protein